VGQNVNSAQEVKKINTQERRDIDGPRVKSRREDFMYCENEMVRGRSILKRGAEKRRKGKGDQGGGERGRGYSVLDRKTAQRGPALGKSVKKK